MTPLLISTIQSLQRLQKECGRFLREPAFFAFIGLLYFRSPLHQPRVASTLFWRQLLWEAGSVTSREVQRDIYLLAEKKAAAQFLAGINTRHGPQPPVYPSTVEVIYVVALKKADMDALMVRLENEIDQLQDRLDQFNHVHRIEVDGRTLELAS